MWIVGWLSALSILVGLFFAFLIAPGIPYDEPAHYMNAKFYAKFGRLPVAGEPETSYESRHGPIAYFIDALVLRCAQGLDEKTAFLH